MAKDPDISHNLNSEIDQILLGLDGFTFSPEKKDYRIVKRLVNYNDSTTSRYFNETASSVSEYTFRFRKNARFFFRGLHFFQEFHGHRGFPQSGGFWGLIRRQVGNGTLCKTAKSAERFVKFLISSRDKFFESTPHCTFHQSDRFSEYIQRLTLHWSTLLSKAEVSSGKPKLSHDDLSRLAERCAEWGKLVRSGRLADSPFMSEFLDHHDLMTRGSCPQDSGFLDPMVHTPGRGLGISAPKNRQFTPRNKGGAPTSGGMPGSEHKIAGFDKRLLASLKLQLQQGMDITSLSSRLHNLGNQMCDAVAATNHIPGMVADIANLQAKAASHADEISALKMQVSGWNGHDERIDQENEAVQQQLKLAVAESLQAELPKQVDSKLNDLVINAIAGQPIKAMIQTAVLNMRKNTGIYRRVQALEQQLNNQHRSSSSPTVNTHSPQEAKAIHDAQTATPEHDRNQARDYNYKAREELIISQHHTIHKQAEKIERLERELGNLGPVSPLPFRLHH